MFTKEQIEQLRPFEEYFISATAANYVRSIPADRIMTITNIWNTASGEKEKGPTSCGVCQLNFIKKVGKHYFKDKEKYEREQSTNLEKQVEEILEFVENNIQKPKRSAKKKEKPE